MGQASLWPTSLPVQLIPVLFSPLATLSDQWDASRPHDGNPWGCISIISVIAHTIFHKRTTDKSFAMRVRYVRISWQMQSRIGVGSKRQGRVARLSYSEIFQSITVPYESSGFGESNFKLPPIRDRSRFFFARAPIVHWLSWDQRHRITRE